MSPYFPKYGYAKRFHDEFVAAQPDLTDAFSTLRTHGDVSAEIERYRPRFDDAPEFDLSSALQSSQGGGGGSSPFQNSGGQDPDEPLEDRVRKLIDLIETTVEPEQWVSSGGEGASVTMFGNSLVVTAPDYIHRQIAGYSFWPSRLQQVRTVDGRRQMHIRPDSPAREKP